MSSVPKRFIIIMVVFLLHQSDICAAPGPPPPSTPPPPPGLPLDGGVLGLVVVAIIYGLYKSFKINKRVS